MPSPILKRLTLDDMDDAALVHRAAFDERLPWLAGLHTPEEDRRFYREQVFTGCEIWGAVEHERIVGVIAFREDWIDHLYVLPSAQGRGAGSALLAIARSGAERLSVWTFQRNAGARRFYERRGFAVIKETDGRDNEENEPDALYSWPAPRA